jgi:hypothetical protein
MAFIFDTGYGLAVGFRELADHLSYLRFKGRSVWRVQFCGIKRPGESIRQAMRRLDLVP